jgi:hypothetical protein
MLPPTDAALRICCDAPERIASEITGKARRMLGALATFVRGQGADQQGVTRLHDVVKRQAADIDKSLGKRMAEFQEIEHCGSASDCSAATRGQGLERFLDGLWL